MKRSEFIARVAGGAFAGSTAGAMTDEGPFARVVKELDLFESNHGCGPNVPSQGRDPRRT
jgi:hypothetical protein